jgi:hypothetical protein
MASGGFALPSLSGGGVSGAGAGPGWSTAVDPDSAWNQDLEPLIDQSGGFSSSSRPETVVGLLQRASNVSIFVGQKWWRTRRAGRETT